MGWFDLLGGAAGGFTQGLSYINKEDHDAREEALQQADEQRKQGLYQMQLQQHTFDQAQKALNYSSGLMNDALLRNQPDLAANYQDDVRNARAVLLGHPDTSPRIMGTPVGAVPAQPGTESVYQDGSDGFGGTAGTPDSPAVPAHNDFGVDPRSFNGLAALSGYVPPPPKLQAFGPDQSIYVTDKSGQIRSLGQTPGKQEGFNVPAGGMHVYPDGRTFKGPAKTFSPQQPHALQHVTMQQSDGTIKAFIFDPNTGTYSEAPNALGGKPAGAAGAKQNAYLLQTVQQLAQKYGGKLTSYGVRPVGAPADTGATLVNGHQTQWGLWNDAARYYPDEATRRKYVAYPGTSAHGDGSAVDAWVPGPQQAAFKQDLINAGLLPYAETDSQLGNHYHITAAGPIAAPARQVASKPLTQPQLAQLERTLTKQAETAVADPHPEVTKTMGFVTPDLAAARRKWVQEQLRARTAANNPQGGVSLDDLAHTLTTRDAARRGTP